MATLSNRPAPVNEDPTTAAVHCTKHGIWVGWRSCPLCERESGVRLNFVQETTT